MSDLDKKKIALAKAQREKAAALYTCFVPTDINSRPKGISRDIIMDTASKGWWMIAPNRSGKTATGAREVAWHFQGNHPFKSRLPEWGDGPLLIMVVGRTAQLIHEELWNNKIKPLLPQGSYGNIQKEGAYIKSVTHIETGNKMIFLSHHDAKNAREKIQGFTAHVVWLDEMPDDESFLSELILRVSATGKVEPGMPLSGYFYASFTPLVENEAIRKVVDECKFPFVKCVLRLEDNPIYEGWSTEQLDDMIRALCGDEVEFRARRYGEWYYSSSRVIRGYEPARNRRPLPFDYSPSLQHAVVVDPAASGKVGATKWVADPRPGHENTWWCLLAQKLDGTAASLLVTTIETNIIGNSKISKYGRICDSSPSGFYKEAQVQGISYCPITDKMDKKLESIEKTNVALYNCHLMLVEGPATEELHTEMLRAKWKTNEKEIVHSHSYHCLDTVRYLLMKLPTREEPPRVYESHLHEAKQMHLREQEQRAKLMKQLTRRSNVWGRSRSSRR